VPSRQDLEGFRAPDSQERVRLLADMMPYIEGWENALSASTQPRPPQLSQLNQRAAELQGRASGVGFGGLAHHLAEFTRLLSMGADSASLRAQLSVVSELVSQARQTLTAVEAGQLRGPPSVVSPTHGPASLEPPRLITVMRPLDADVAAALKAAQAQQEPPPPLTFAPSLAAPKAPAPVEMPARAPVAPYAAWQPPQPAAPPAAGAPNTHAAPQFGVKNMLGLRAFGSDLAANREAAGPNKSSLLPLPGLGGSGRGSEPARASRPPRFVAPDASGLPPLPPEVPGKATGSRHSDEIKQRLRPERASSQSGERAALQPRLTPRAGALRGRPAPGANRGMLWVGLAGMGVVLSIGLVAFFTLGRRPPRSTAEASSSGTPDLGAVAATSASAAGTSAHASAELPRERLLADDERFTALLAQVHGHGGKESPELRSLLNDQAALASKALSGKCKDGSPTCKAWSDIRDLMVGDHNQPIVKRRRGSDTETTRSQWMAGLKMPGIPVEDDPRVLRVFEFYTENPVGRETFQSMLFRCGAYRDLIQSTLIRYDLPADLMALAFTESGCEPSAKSPVGAAGLWQFMPETGRAYHLRIVEGTIDERYSPFKSTEAGIRMLADLRQKLGSWDLVFASYNLGPFGVLARVERAGGDASFWDLVDAGLLPDETANYSPTVEAIALILANLQRLKFAGIQIRAPQLTADLEVPGGTRLGLVARAAATSVAQLHALNLDFSGDVVPLIPGGSIAVQVPKDVVWQARDTMKDLLSSKDGSDQCVPPTFDWGKQRFTPEMDAACQKRLGAALGAANPAAN
jgi:hypothetical protein